jgi:hypothetical protein
MLGAAWRANASRTVHWRGWRGRRGSCGRAGYNNDSTGRGPRSRQSYKLHSCCFSRGLETSCGCVSGGQEPVELQATKRAPVEDWRCRAAAPVEDWSRQTSSEPATGVMDRLQSCQSSDSESRSLRTAGLGQPAEPHHSAAPPGVRRGTSDGHHTHTSFIDKLNRGRQSASRKGALHAMLDARTCARVQLVLVTRMSICLIARLLVQATPQSR